ncbi:MAG: 23S rRNA (adenine(2030)-N(6))-methyltransferase RlmJ [Xanthobacteraceae bacterium]|jgi:23S rRNA (adenine2030-N6)-methyltransferase
MNYQHAFHAGNFADVHKHIVLTRILDYLRQKPAAFRVVDTHAGAGLYNLLGPQAARSGEWRDGIGRLFAMPRSGATGTDSLQALVAPYLDIITALNPAGTLRLYPGSPLIVKALLRRQDRLIACELEPSAAASLKAALHGDARAKVLSIDGWVGLFANVPPKERRGLVVIDPPYEETVEFARLSDALAQAYRKWPNGLYLLWYPIKAREAPDALARRLRRLSVPKILRCEFSIAPPRADGALAGSGLIIVNPPFPLERELRELLPAFMRLLAPMGACRLDWLSGE